MAGSNEMTAYHCQACGLRFSIDLHPREITFCPICASGKDTLVLEGERQGTECTACGLFLWQDQAAGCQECGRALCDGCLSAAERCPDCLRRSSLLRAAASETIQ